MLPSRTATRIPRVFFVVNSDRAFLTHRASWADAFAARGYEVHVIAPDTGYSAAIRARGFRFENIDLGRENITAVAGALAALRVLTMLLRTRPQFVFLVQTAAYTLGWPAAAFLRRTKFVRVAGGVGRALGEAGKSTSRSARIVRSSLRTSRRYRNVFTLFQTESDESTFVDQGLADRARSWVIPGTGIDTTAWTSPTRDYSGRLVIGFASRLYREKGVEEFAEAAELLRDTGHRFVIVGAPDDGVSTAVPRSALEAWQADGRLEWWGYQDDMSAVFQQFDLLVFPSRHPEGTPRTLIEAAACGVPSIVSDQPGCRAVVDEGETGWILPATDAQDIEALVRTALADRTHLAEVSRRARRHAVERFGLDQTIRALMGALNVPSQAAAEELRVRAGGALA